MTIEERAKRASGYSLGGHDTPSMLAAYNAYQEGYKDAIEKAARWLAKHYHSAETIGNITCTSVMTEGLLTEDFRKAMED